MATKDNGAVSQRNLSPLSCDFSWTSFTELSYVSAVSLHWGLESQPFAVAGVLETGDAPVSQKLCFYCSLLRFLIHLPS